MFWKRETLKGRGALRGLNARVEVRGICAGVRGPEQRAVRGWLWWEHSGSETMAAGVQGRPLEAAPIACTS